MTPEETAARRVELLAALARLDAQSMVETEDPETEEVEITISAPGPVEPKLQSPTPEESAAREARQNLVTSEFMVHYVPKSKINDPEQIAYCKEHGCSAHEDMRFHAVPYHILADRKYWDAFRSLEDVVVRPSNGRWLDTGETTWERLCRLWAELGIEIPNVEELRAEARAAYRMIDGKPMPDYPDRFLISTSPETWQEYGQPRPSKSDKWE